MASGITSSNSYRYSGKGYFDAKMQPVENVDALSGITRTLRFSGLTVTVLNPGTTESPQDPCDYWFMNNAWVKKPVGADIKIGGDDITE